MKNQKLILSIILSFVFITFMQAQTLPKGLTLYKGTDKKEFIKQYNKHKDRWDKAFKWMETHDVATMAPGKYDIDGEHCFANVQETVLRTPDKIKIESHKKYVDLQWCVKGVERYGIVNSKDAKLLDPYRFDVMHWTANKVKYVDSNPHTFYLFFPDNYHKACVLPDNAKTNTIKKVCIKIEYDEKSNK